MVLNGKANATKCAGVSLNEKTEGVHLHTHSKQGNNTLSFGNHRLTQGLESVPRFNLTKNKK